MQNNYILNEKKFVEELLSSSTLDKDISANLAINYMTRYFAEYSNMNLEEIKNEIFKKMDSFRLSATVYQQHKASTRIEKMYKLCIEDKISKLKTFDSIPIYESECKRILECENNIEKKVLFTLYVLARFTNIYGWVYQKENEIYKLANVSTTNKNKGNVFRLLREKGLIKDTKRVDDLKVGVELSDGNEQIKFEVKEIKNLGNFFIANTSPLHIQCECCGSLIKIKSDNDYSTKYCTKCAKEKELENTKLRVQKFRNSKM